MKLKMLFLTPMIVFIGACSNVDSLTNETQSEEESISFVQNGDEWTGFYKEDGYEAFHKMAFKSEADNHNNTRQNTFFPAHAPFKEPGDREISHHNR